MTTHKDIATTPATSPNVAASNVRRYWRAEAQGSTFACESPSYEMKAAAFGALSARFIGENGLLCVDPGRKALHYS